MALGEPVRVRLEERKQAAFEDEAARRGEPLGTYLRRRLEEGAEATMDLVELRREVADLTRELSNSRRQIADLVRQDQKATAPGPIAPPKAEAAVSNDELKAILLETLLILRTMAPPTDVRSAQSMMRRLKISHWAE